jgi:hypothetical protein
LKLLLNFYSKLFVSDFLFVIFFLPNYFRQKFSFKDFRSKTFVSNFFVKSFLSKIKMFSNFFLKLLLLNFVYKHLCLIFLISDIFCF